MSKQKLHEAYLIAGLMSQPAGHDGFSVEWIHAVNCAKSIGKGRETDGRVELREGNCRGVKTGLIAVDDSKELWDYWECGREGTDRGRGRVKTGLVAVDERVAMGAQKRGKELREWGVKDRVDRC